jgi:hypothetical protein
VKEAAWGLARYAAISQVPILIPSPMHFQRRNSQRAVEKLIYLWK